MQRDAPLDKGYYTTNLEKDPALFRHPASTPALDPTAYCQPRADMV